MAILLTGGMGYIGSHIAVELIQKNKKIIIIDNLSNSKIDCLDKIEELTGTKPKFYQADIRDENRLDAVFLENEIESVIHLAGLKAVGESTSIPLKYYDNNVGGTLTLLNMMQKHECNKLVFSSSATVYGLGSNPPFKEDAPLSATNPYGRTKLMIEEILQDLCNSNPEMKITILRYFNPIGAHPSGLIGENPSDIPNNLVPYIAKVASNELRELRIFGDDYETADGTGVRDYIHVVDLAKGHLKALDYLDSHLGCEVFNLGTGIGYSVLDVRNTYQEVSRKEIPSVIENRRAGDIAICYADVSKAKEILQWSSENSLEKMCRDSWNFITANAKDNSKKSR